MKKYFITLTFAFCLIIFGAVFTFWEITDFTISDTFGKETIKSKTMIYDLTINNDVTEIDAEASNETTITYDNSLAVGTFKIAVTYYDKIINIDKSSATNNDTEVIFLDVDYAHNVKTLRNIIEITVDGLKKNTLYNYSKALLPNVEVFINEADKDSIKIR